MKRSEALRRFLTGYAPEILVGTTMIFKHKQALYLMLRAEERLNKQVQPQSVMTMALADMRGTLVDRGQIHARYHFSSWCKIHDIVTRTDRHSLDLLMRDTAWAQMASRNHVDSKVSLQKLVEARWINRTQAADVRKRNLPKRLAKPDKQSKLLRDTAYFLACAEHGIE